MGWRRRYCPSPVFIALFVALCVFYQCLSLFWKSTSWTKDCDIRRSLGLLEVATKNKECLCTWNSIVTKIKNYEERFKKKPLSNLKEMIMLHIYQSIGIKESTLYKRVLTKLEYRIHQFADVDSIKAFFTHNQKTLGRDALIYISLNKSMEARCEERRELLEFAHFTIVNLLPQMMQTLCMKDEICRLAAHFPALQNFSMCTYRPEESRDRKITSADFQSSSDKKNNQYLTTPGMNQLFESLYQNIKVYHYHHDHHHHHPFQDFPVIRTFVLITSLSPLRAFIHSMALVQTEPKKLFAPMQLHTFYRHFFKSDSPLQAFNALKETISKLLLTLEVISEAAATGHNSWSRCSECFQLLTLDIGYSSASRPSVLEVREQVMSDDLSTDGYTTMEAILEDALHFVLYNHSSSVLEVMEKAQTCLSIKNTCWMDSILDLTWEQVDNLCSLLLEQTKLGKFEMLYPSDSVQVKALRHDIYHRTDLRENLGSILAVHELLSDLYECLQSFQKKYLTNRQKFQNTEENELAFVSRQMERKSETRKWTNCSNDNDTLSYISGIFSYPPLDLTPEFNPKMKDYYAELPFDVVTVEIGTEPANCNSQVHLDDKNGPRIAKYPLGLGTNHITLHVTDDSSQTPVLLRSYRITIYREDRPSLPLFDHYKMCGFVQDCGLIIYADEPCGLLDIPNETIFGLSYAYQKKCETGDAKGLWLVPCLSCSDNRTCDWRAISWQPYKCHHPVLQNHELQHCLMDRKIIFIGDSTNRGMMYYLMEKVNGSLEDWQKTHGMKFYTNINSGRTTISYSYYPQFWIDIRKRPTFEEALVKLIKRSHPLQNTNQTILVVGGVQWLNTDHLRIIQRVLKRENLLNILVIIKSIGMGFHLPVHGIRSLSPIQISQLSDENSLILKTAKLYGYEVVDTFSITMGRYKEFLQGKCGCHFHEVVKSHEEKEKKMKLMKNYTIGDKIFPLVHDNLSQLSQYHVQGPVNQVYSEILLSRMCT
ncbi:cadherin-like and PC-esterase domain-containing protein 1 isoform X2 [Phyllobates terribilis]|uniref:cadherin-like and PC-esterase domain-containing protein 1 isoform X2 n=1 Tax=Phyllobates terribilis TaxID=111132 RepID=UPI003CCACD13